MMKSVFRLYQIANILSLDVATGAVVCAAFFADLFSVTILPQGLAALGLAVWIIYTIDHLLDARKLKDKASTARHQFHHLHFKILFAIWIVMVCIEVILIFFLRTQIFRSGLILAAIVILYILINQWLKYAKEVAGALLYCGGILLPVFALKPHLFNFNSIFLIAPFVLIVLTNLILFSWMDYEKDKMDAQPSIVTLAGKKTGTLILLFLFFCITIALFFSFNDLSRDVFVIYGLMTSVLLYIFLKPDLLNTNDRFRYMGDAIFLLPLLHWVL
jgi:hypothetical protein